MNEDHERSGRFAAGNRANPNGRPRKTRSLNEEIARELSAKVTITENGKRKRVSKLSASAKQITNQGASGDLKADKERAEAPGTVSLTESDTEIVGRFIERLKATELFEEHSDDDAQPNGV